MLVETNFFDRGAPYLRCRLELTLRQVPDSMPGQADLGLSGEKTPFLPNRGAKKNGRSF
jgi:hypothetical protein